VMVNAPLFGCLIDGSAALVLYRMMEEYVPAGPLSFREEVISLSPHATVSATNSTIGKSFVSRARIIFRFLMGGASAAEKITPLWNRTLGPGDWSRQSFA